MKVELKVCPYCKGIAKGHIKTVESFKTIHNYYVACAECGASTERYDTEFAYYLNGKRFSPMTKRKAISKAVCDWNNGIFNVETRLFHMSDAEKILWHTEHLLFEAWHGAMVPMESLQYKTAWRLREIAEDKKLLSLKSGKNYDLGEVAKILVEDLQVVELVAYYLKVSG